MRRCQILLSGCCLLVAGVGIGTPDALGQYRYNPQITPTGQLFDANPQIGATRFYEARPASPLLGGNLTATGNVRGGLSLRSYSPISDPLAFRGGLPSSRLSGFVRDSVSVADAANPGGQLPGGFSQQAFFDPASTVPSVAYLSGGYGTGLAASRVRPEINRPPPSPGLLNYAGPIDQSLNLEYSPDRRSVSTLGVDTSLDMTSSLFGMRNSQFDFSSRSARALDESFNRLTQVREANSARKLGDPRGEDFSAVTRAPDSVSAAVAGASNLLDPSRPSAAAIENPGLPGGMRPLDFALNADASGLFRRQEGVFGTGGLGVDSVVAAPGRQPGTLGSPLQPGLPGIASAAVQPGEAPSAQAGLGGIPVLPMPGIMPGQDKFTDIQLAVSLMRNPDAPWFGDLQRLLRENPTMGSTAQEFAQMQSREFLNSVINTPLRSFATDSNEGINSEMRQAETLLHAGRFADAAATFERARVYEPQNPLPLIGRGHALLAAGDYASAAVSLIQGLERFPELSRLQLDLRSLIGGGEVVDIRRSDLMRQLSNREDPRLRFLLGYLEYHSGKRDEGLRNLEKAAELADPGSLYQRYPAMLKGEGLLPPPKLAPNVAPLDQTAAPAEGAQR